MAKIAYKGTNSNLIAYKGDHEPIKVALGGSVVENLSFKEKSTSGTSSVSYTSEYKKNLLEMKIQGNSVQNGTPTIDAPIDIVNAGENGLSVKINDNIVAIPSEVMLSNKAIIPLRFAKVGEGRDTLTVDRIDNRVVYKKCVEHIRLGDKGSFVNYKTNGVFIAGALTAKESYAQGYCNRDAVMASFNLNKGIVIGAGTNYVYWLGILDTLGFTDNWVDKSNPTSEEKKQANTDLKNWLAENPTYIYYELDTPIEYDLTNTDLGQELLSLTNYTQNQENKIEIISELEPSGLNVTYAKWGAKE